MHVDPADVWFLTFIVAVFCALLLVRRAGQRPWLISSDDDGSPDLDAVMKAIVLLFVVAAFCYALVAGYQAASTLE